MTKSPPKWLTIEAEVAYLEYVANKSPKLKAVVETILEERLKELDKQKDSRKKNTAILKYQYFLRRIRGDYNEMSPTEVANLTGGKCHSVIEAINLAKEKMLKRPEFQSGGEFRWYCYKEDYNSWLD